MRFIRDQCTEWCNHDFVEAAMKAKPSCLRHLIDPSIDWYAVWRAL